MNCTKKITVIGEAAKNIFTGKEYEQLKELASKIVMPIQQLQPDPYKIEELTNRLSFIEKEFYDVKKQNVKFRNLLTKASNMLGHSASYCMENECICGTEEFKEEIIIELKKSKNLT